MQASCPADALCSLCAPATIVGVPGPLQVTSHWTVPEAELSWRFSRSSGPGGQGVNTTDSRAELSFDVAASGSVPEHLRARILERLAGRLVDGVVTVAASEQRSQLQNRESAEQRLGQLLREAAAPPPRQRRPTRPTKGSKERRLEGKRQRSQIKRGRGTRNDE
jgi:ribosome-associated protein